MTGLEWIALAAVCLGGAASPGPSLAVVTSGSIKGGRPSGLSAAWAHALGVGFYAALTVLGLGALITSIAWVFQGLQLAGAAYLFWLAWRLWRASDESGSTAESPAEKIEVAAQSPSQAAIDGFAIAFLNPKLAVFMFALLSQFIGDELSMQRGAIMVATVFMTDGLWYTLVAVLLTKGTLLETMRRNSHRIDQGFAIMLALVASVILIRL